jgi:hypothetical protein
LHDGLQPQSGKRLGMEAAKRGVPTRLTPRVLDWRKEFLIKSHCNFSKLQWLFILRHV